MLQIKSITGKKTCANHALVGGLLILPIDPSDKDPLVHTLVKRGFRTKA